MCAFAEEMFSLNIWWWTIWIIFFRWKQVLFGRSDTYLKKKKFSQQKCVYINQRFGGDAMHTGRARWIQLNTFSGSLLWWWREMCAAPRCKFHSPRTANAELNCELFSYIKCTMRIWNLNIKKIKITCVRSIICV